MYFVRRHFAVYCGGRLSRRCLLSSDLAVYGSDENNDRDGIKQADRWHVTWPAGARTHSQNHLYEQSWVETDLRTLSSSSFLIRSSSSTASWVALRSVSNFLFTFSTSARTFFSRSRLSCICSRASQPTLTSAAVLSCGLQYSWCLIWH